MHFWGGEHKIYWKAEILLLHTNNSTYNQNLSRNVIRFWPFHSATIFWDRPATLTLKTDYKTKWRCGPKHGYVNEFYCTHTIPVNPYSLPVWKYRFFIILGGYGHTGKWIQENIIFMRFCCCFKLSKTEKLSNEQPVNAITKCTLAGLVQ